MPVVQADGIDTYYETHGHGQPILMMAPGGFDATVEKWSTAGVWRAMRPLETLMPDTELIVYDRRETGRSGGRLEPLSWESYAAHAKGVLDATRQVRAIILGACMGCSVALAFAAKYPEACEALILHWPVGGFRWRQMGQDRFNRHLDTVAQQGLQSLPNGLALDASFWTQPTAGPWARCLARDAAFRDVFAAQDPERYVALVTRSRDALFGSSFPTGVQPIDLPGIKVPTLIVPGGDEVHTRSAAYALAELLPAPDLQDIPFAEQTADRVRLTLTRFIAAVSEAE